MQRVLKNKQPPTPSEKHRTVVPPCSDDCWKRLSGRLTASGCVRKCGSLCVSAMMNLHWEQSLLSVTQDFTFVWVAIKAGKADALNPRSSSKTATSALTSGGEGGAAVGLRLPKDQLPSLLIKKQIIQNKYIRTLVTGVKVISISQKVREKKRHQKEKG